MKQDRVFHHTFKQR